MHPEEVLESTLRDAILDNEDKIWSGGLGSIKVKDRAAWRTGLETNNYDAQDGTVESSHNSITIESSNEFSAFCPPSVASQPSKQDFDQVPSTSSSPSPSAWSSPNIKDLARALVQVADCVQTRYISEPLASGAEYKRQLEKAEAEIERRKLKEEEEENVDPKKSWRAVQMPESPMERWKGSVRGSTSLSQLFLHLITLENSISWHRSALKASCKICRKKGDPDKMLLCDKCDRGFHLYCLKPPLQNIPEGNWFCLSCTPKEPEDLHGGQTRRNLNPYKESNSDGSSEDENEEENSESERGSDDDDGDDDDDSEYKPRRTVKEKPKKIYSSDESDYKPKYKKPRLRKMCTFCHKGGQLVSCDTCSENFHSSCTKPPLRRIPRGKWHCQKCLKKGNKGSSSQNSDSSNSTRSSARKHGLETSESSGRSTSNSRQARTDLLLDVSACEEILESLSKHHESWPFTGGKKKADYKRIVKRPVDLHSIHVKLNGMNYSSNNQFVADVYLMFQNCELFNSSKSDEHESSKRLSRYFQTLLRRYKIKDVNEGDDLLSKRPKRSF